MAVLQSKSLPAARVPFGGLKVMPGGYVHGDDEEEEDGVDESDHSLPLPQTPPAPESLSLGRSSIKQRRYYTMA